MADQPGADQQPGQEQGGDQEDSQSQSQESQSQPTDSSSESLLEQNRRKNAENKSLRDRLRAAEEKLGKVEEEALAEQGKWKEIAEKRAAEVEEERAKRAELVAGLQQTRRDAALERELAKAGVPDDVRGFVRNGILAEVGDVEYDDSHKPLTDFSKHVQEAARKLGFAKSDDDSQTGGTQQSQSPAQPTQPPPWGSGSGQRHQPKPQTLHEFSKSVVDKIRTKKE